MLNFCSRNAYYRKDKTLENCFSVDSTNASALISTLTDPSFLMNPMSSVDSNKYDCVQNNNGKSTCMHSIRTNQIYT